MPPSSLKLICKSNFGDVSENIHRLWVWVGRSPRHPDLVGFPRFLPISSDWPSLDGVPICSDLLRFAPISSDLFRLVSTVCILGAK